MSHHPSRAAGRLLGRFLAASFFFVGLSAHAASSSEKWHTADGQVVQGRLCQLLGSLAIIAGRTRTDFLEVEKLSDAELQRVAAFTVAPEQRPVPWAEAKSKVARSVAGDLLVLRDDKLVPFAPPPGAPEPEIYLIYFSAGWCPPCHRFTPILVQAYQEFQRQAPGRFDVIFVSSDRGATAQAGYVREMAMPWPVLHYASVGRTPEIERWAGDGIPCLVALTRSGDLLVHSYSGKGYLGPEHVLDFCRQILPLLNPESPAVKRSRHRLAIAEHRLRSGSADAPAKPYLIEVDRQQFGTIKFPPLTLTLKVNAAGRVTDVGCDDKVPTVVADLVSQIAREWLFLPALKQGEAIATTLSLPVILSPSSGNVAGSQ